MTYVEKSVLPVSQSCIGMHSTLFLLQSLAVRGIPCSETGERLDRVGSMGPKLLLLHERLVPQNRTESAARKEALETCVQVSKWIALLPLKNPTHALQLPPLKLPFLRRGQNFCFCTKDSCRRIDIYLSTYLPTYLSIYLSVYLIIYLSIYLSIHPSIYLSTYLSNLSNLSNLSIYLINLSI